MKNEEKKLKIPTSKLNHIFKHLRFPFYYTHFYLAFSCEIKSNKTYFRKGSYSKNEIFSFTCQKKFEFSF